MMITYIPAREWIPCRTRKPKDGEDVLGVIRFADNLPYIDIVYWDSRDGEWISTNGLEVVRVVYWTEMPKIPYRVRGGKVVVIRNYVES